MQKVLLLSPLAPFKSACACKKVLVIFLSRNRIVLLVEEFSSAKWIP